MTDFRLNSIHLEAPRRQEYRRARQLLLNARGAQTLFVSNGLEDSQLQYTIIHEVDGGTKRELACWLSDGEFIYPLRVGVNTLGRSSDNDVVLEEDAFASRRHCAILVHSTDSAELHDTASKNGTHLNGKRITEPTALRCGDEIRISERSFHFLTRFGEPNALPLQATLSG
ncbi:MAG: FHA domain-containing protein [Gemmataceae bacterium]